MPLRRGSVYKLGRKPKKTQARGSVPDSVTGGHGPNQTEPGLAGQAGAEARLGGLGGNLTNAQNDCGSYSNQGSGSA